MKRRGFLAGLAAWTLGSEAVAVAAVSPSEKSLVGRYVEAIAAHRYAVAFNLLEAQERHYFASPSNFASVFRADRLEIERFRIVGSRRDPLGMVVLVRERVAFYDHAHQAVAHADLTVPYGLPVPGPVRVRDPFHPWRAVAVSGLAGQSGGVHVAVRKLSFFTGRLEAIVTFANVGSRTVTLLPYGRSAVRDRTGRAYTPLATRLPSLTDPTLYTGLRLAPDSQYTGVMTFGTPARLITTALAFTFGPALADGAREPCEVVLPPYALAPSASVAGIRSPNQSRGRTVVVEGA